MYKTVGNIVWNSASRSSSLSRFLLRDGCVLKRSGRWHSSNSGMPQPSDPEVGTTAQVSFRVDSSDLASAIAKEPEDTFPAVFATSRLVALMEIASARILKPHLDSTQLSVGVSLDVTHTAPTAMGGTVIADATYKGKEGKLFVFDVVAKDNRGEVGKAVHKRAIVDQARLESAAKERVTQQQNL